MGKCTWGAIGMLLLGRMSVKWLLVGESRKMVGMAGRSWRGNCALDSGKERLAAGVGSWSHG